MDQTQPGQPDLAEDDLQRSPEQDAERHRQSSAILQEAVVEIVDRCQGWSLDDAIAALEESLARRGQPPQPPRWVESVAMDAIAGRTYVVNQQALDETGIDVPAHDIVQQSVGRDRGDDPA